MHFAHPDPSGDNTSIREFDQVMILGKLKVVVCFEVKTSFDPKESTKRQQLQGFKQMLDTHYPMGEGWRLVNVYVFTRWLDQGKAERLCPACHPFMLRANTEEEVRKWFQDLLARLEQPRIGEDSKGSELKERGFDTG